MDNGLWTEKFNDEPISGKVYGYFGTVEPLKKVYVGNLLNGKKEGRWKSYYHSTGKKEYDYNFKDGNLILKKKYCYDHWVNWKKFNNPKYIEKYCNSCGEEFPTSFDKPYCKDCVYEYFS